MPPKLMFPVVETTKQSIEQIFQLVYFQHVTVISKGKYIDQLCVYCLNIIDRLRDESLTVGSLIDHMRNLFVFW